MQQVHLIADLDLNNDMMLVSGSTIGNSSTLEPYSVLSDDKLTLLSGMSLTSDMNLTTGSKLGYGSFIKYGSKIWADATLISTMTLEEAVSLASDMPLATDLILGKGSSPGDGSVLVKGSNIYLKLDLLGKMDIGEDIVLDPGSEISDSDGSRVAAGTTICGDALLAESIALKNNFNISRGSLLGPGSILKNGSDIGGTIKTAFTENVGKDGMDIQKDSVLAKGSVIAAGTFLTGDILAIDGTIYPRGTFLKNDIIIGQNTLSQGITLEQGSKIAADSVINANSGGDYASTLIKNTKISKFSDISVLSSEDAQRAIGISDSAIKDIDRIRSDLGSVQNQFMSAIAVISAMRINIFSSESYIRDIDFSDEMDNFSKIKILAEAGSFALSKSNTRASDLLSLLKPYGQK